MFKDIGKHLLVDRKLYKVFVKLSYIGIYISICWFFYLPEQGQSNQIEENALNPQLMDQYQSEIMGKETEKILSQLQNTNNIQDYIVQYMEKQYMHTYIQNINGFSNIIGKLHTKRTHGYECNIFVYEYSQQKLRNAALMMSFMQMLSQSDINYLSRDILFVGYPSELSKYGVGINYFLQEYIKPKGVSKLPRCGVIRQAINVNLDDDFNTIALKLFGINGRVPDRDFFLNINHLMVKAKLPFTYQEGGQDRFLKLQEQLETLVRYIWQLLNLNSVYRLPSSNIFKFKSFLSVLLDCIHGNIHDQHSYLYKFGIPAITVRGYKNQNLKNHENAQKLTGPLSRVIEGANHAYMALDEHLHSGSTMYIPTQKESSITIQKYVWPAVIGCFTIVILVLRDFIPIVVQEKDLEKRARIHRNVASVWLKHIILELCGFITLFIPLLFNPQSQDFFRNYAILTFGAYAFSLFILVPLLRKYFFGRYIQERNFESMNHSQHCLSLHLGLGTVYCLILNVAICYLIILTMFPWMQVIQSIRPCFRSYNLKSIFSYLLNLLYFGVYVYLIYNFLSFEQVLEIWKESLQHFTYAGTHVLGYLHIIGFTGFIRMIDLLLF